MSKLRNLKIKIFADGAGVEQILKLDKKEYSNMIFYSKKIIVTTLTTHVQLKNINKC